MTNRTLSVLVDDLLDQSVEVIVSEWYYNRPAWWLLLPSALVRQLRFEAGAEVFRELSEEEPLDEGEASLTGAGRLPHKGIVHVATRNVWGASSEAAVRAAVRSAMNEVRRLGFRSVAFPVLGVGRHRTERQAYELLRDILLGLPTDIEVRIVRSPDRPE